jgi:hypothetical protein
VVPALLAFFSGPVGWTVLAVAAVVAMAIAFRKPITKFLTWLWNEFSKAMAQLGKLLYDVFVRPWIDLWNNVLRGPVTGLWEWIKSAFTTAWTAIVAIGYQLFVVPWIRLWEGLKPYVTGLWEWIKSAFTTAWTAIVAIGYQLFVVPWVRLWEGLKPYVTGLWEWIKVAASVAWAKIMELAYTVFVEPWVTLWNKVLREPVSKAWEWLTQTWGQIAKFFTKYVTKPISSAWNSMSTGVQNAWKKVSEFIPKAMEVATNKVKSIFGDIVVFIANGINSVTRSINNLIKRFNSVAAASRNPFRISELKEVTVPKFAQGGIVDRSTLAVVGDGGEREYIVPESKMAAASSRFLAGQRGASVIPSSASTGAANGISPIQITIKTGPVMQSQDGQRWMTIEDGERMARQAVEQMQRISRTPGGRYAMGVR